MEQSIIETIWENQNKLIVITDKASRNFSIVKREFTGHGFFTHFDPESKIRFSEENFEIHGELLINDITQCGYVIFIRNSVLSMLEGFGYGEDFPNNIKTFKVIPSWE